jgi:hypothetical protein
MVHGFFPFGVDDAAIMTGTETTEAGARSRN